jgi:hypothetical protein
MDNLNEEDLKRAFEKLRHYESPGKGIHWESLQQAMSVQSIGKKVFRVVILLSILSFFIFLPGPTLFDNVKPSTIGHESKHPAIMSAGNEKVQPDTASLTLDRTPGYRIALLDNPHAPAEAAQNNTPANEALQLYHYAADDLADSNLTNFQSMDSLGSHLASDSTEIQASSLSPATASEAGRAPEERQQTNLPKIMVSPFYLFGIVDPLKYDKAVLKTPSSMTKRY